jgi:hypothetical protein
LKTIESGFERKLALLKIVKHVIKKMNYEKEYLLEVTTRYVNSMNEEQAKLYAIFLFQSLLEIQADLLKQSQELNSTYLEILG